MSEYGSCGEIIKATCPVCEKVHEYHLGNNGVPGNIYPGEYEVTDGKKEFYCKYCCSFFDAEGKEVL